MGLGFVAEVRWWAWGFHPVDQRLRRRWWVEALEPADWVLRDAQAGLDGRSTLCDHVEYGDSELSRELVVKLEFVSVQEEGHCHVLGHKRGQPG